MAYQDIIVKKEDNIATITFNRPAALNAFTTTTMTEVAQALEDIADDGDIRVLILTGAGRAFCAGADVRVEKGGEREIGEMRPELIRQHLRRTVQKVTQGIRGLEIPTIAMVNGPAAGGGFDWCLACDMRIGSENSRFKVAFTSLAVVSPDGSLWLLPRIVGESKAMELVFTDNLIFAQEAKDLGILNRLVPHDQLQEETLALARQIAEGPPTALKLAKLLITKGMRMDWDTAVEFAATAQTINLPSRDHKEGADAFREKRKPTFNGF